MYYQPPTALIRRGRTLWLLLDARSPGDRQGLSDEIATRQIRSCEVRDLAGQVHKTGNGCDHNQ